MTAVLLDRQRHLDHVDLLDHAWGEGRKGLEVMATRGAAVEAMIEGAAVDSLGREGGALVLGMAGLAADAASVLAFRRRRLGRLDDVGGGGLGGGRGVLACRGELLTRLGDDLPEVGEFRLQDIDSRLKPSAIGATDRLLGSHGGLFYRPSNTATTTVNGHDPEISNLQEGVFSQWQGPAPRRDLSQRRFRSDAPEAGRNRASCGGTRSARGAARRARSLL